MQFTTEANLCRHLIYTAVLFLGEYSMHQEITILREESTEERNIALFNFQNSNIISILLGSKVTIIRLIPTSKHQAIQTNGGKAPCIVRLLHFIQFTIYTEWQSKWRYNVCLVFVTRGEVTVSAVHTMSLFLVSELRVFSKLVKECRNAH